MQMLSEKYSYCWNNPLKYTDSSGYDETDPLTWAEIMARNYTWGESYTNNGGSWYNTYDLDRLIQIAKNNALNHLNGALLDYNMFAIQNSIKNEDGTYSRTGPNNRTNTYAGYSGDGPHFSDKRPIWTIEDGGVLTGIFANEYIIDGKTINQKIFDELKYIREASNSEYANPFNEPWIWGPQGEDFSYSSSWRNIGLWMRSADESVLNWKNKRSFRIVRNAISMNPIVAIGRNVNIMITGEDAMLPIDHPGRIKNNGFERYGLTSLSIVLAPIPSGLLPWNVKLLVGVFTNE